MNLDARIFVAGHGGLLGSALLKTLKARKFSRLLTLARDEVDYGNLPALENFFAQNKPEFVFLAAGRTGGILANKTYPADFLHENLVIQTHFFHLCAKYKVKAMVFFSSSCVYPKLAPQPIQESSLFQGEIESTSQAYAAAKLAGMLGCQAYTSQYPETKMICLLPNSLYGPNDNFSLDNSHVLAALIRKIHDAKVQNQPEVWLWGTGSPKREFVFSEDAASAAIFAIENRGRLENKHYNIGSGTDCSIAELAGLICGVVGYKGKVQFDSTKPDGTPRKLLDSSRFEALGWKTQIDLQTGIRLTYEQFLGKQ